MVARKITYVNGRYLPHDMASVHIEDRGYQFSDGIYEVVAIHNRKMLDEDLHFKRLERSLKNLSIRVPVSINAIKIIIYELVRRNKIINSYIYIQVTRGVAKRNHPFPKGDVKPALVIMFTDMKAPSLKEYLEGVRVITTSDLRWHRRDIKSISLLANILAKQEAVVAGVKESWLIDDVRGVITEGSSTNAYIVDAEDVLRTHPVDENILSGVTRDVVIRLAKENGIKIIEEPFKLEEVINAKEAFITSTTAGVLPVVSVDGKKIGAGKPGKITKKLISLYNNYMNIKLNN